MKLELTNREALMVRLGLEKQKMYYEKFISMQERVDEWTEVVTAEIEIAKSLINQIDNQL